MVPLDELPSMALFVQVVQLRSFSAAGRAAGIAKSAVSKRIAALEERLGVRLLIRTTRKLSLTAEGLLYYEHCAALVASATSAAEAVAGSSQVARGTLRINAPVTFTQLYLSRAIAAFLARHPDLEVALTLDDRLVDVVEGGFDVVVRIARLAESSLVARRLTTARLVIAASPAYLAGRGRPERPEELVNHNCLRYALIPADREWRFGRRGARYKVPVRGNLVVNDGAALREAVRAGLGLAILPDFMIARELADGRLVTVLGEHLDAEIGIHAVYASRRQLPLRTKLFLDFAVAWFGGRPWPELLGDAGDATSSPAG